MHVHVEGGQWDVVGKGGGLLWRMCVVDRYREEMRRGNWMHGEVERIMGRRRCMRRLVMLLTW